MQKNILTEIQELKRVITLLIGVSDLPFEEQFSKPALDKAAKQFQKLNIERGDWVSESDFNKYIKKASYGSGKFIITQFKFTNYFKKGNTHYFNKLSLIELANALKERNIDFERYRELVEDQTKFKKSLTSAAENKKGKRKSFEIEDNLKDITTSPIPPPPAETIRQDLIRLKEDFFKLKFSDYIDIYKNNHAMLKFMYHFEKYLEQGLKKRCKKWCEDFNYANNALEQITNKIEIFIPVAEDDMFEL